MWRRTADAINARPLQARLVLEVQGAPEEDAGIMEQLAIVLRSQEDVRFVIRYGDKGKITESDYTITEDADLPASLGHPHFVPAVITMAAWLEQKLLEGRIPPGA